jgi:hypothetical protein
MVGVNQAGICYTSSMPQKAGPHSPVRGLQVQEMQGSDGQTLGVPAHVPLVHTSLIVQLLVSLHAVPSGMLTSAQAPAQQTALFGHLWVRACSQRQAPHMWQQGQYGCTVLCFSRDMWCRACLRGPGM